MHRTMKFHLILAILCCSVVNNTALDFATISNFIPTSVIGTFANTVAPGTGTAGTALAAAWQSWMNNGSMTDIGGAALDSAKGSLPPIFQLGAEGLNLLNRAYKGENFTEGVIKAGEGMLKRQLGEVGGTAVKNGLEAIYRWRNNDSVTDIVKDLGRDAIRYVPGGDGLLVAADVATSLSNGDSPMDVIKKVGAAPFKKYVPHGEEAFAIIDAIDAVTNNRTDGILNNSTINAAERLLPKDMSEKIVKAIKIGKSLQNEEERQELIKKYGEKVIDQYGGPNEELKKLMKQAANSVPGMIINMITPAKKEEPKPEQETESGSAVIPNKGSALKGTANKKTPSKAPPKKTTPKKEPVSKPAATKRSASTGSIAKKPTTSPTPNRSKSDTWVKHERERLDRDTEKNSKKKCWISHPAQKRREREEKKEKSFMSKIGLKKY